jgi:glycerol-3-phosphate dehydrogenase
MTTLAPVYRGGPFSGWQVDLGAWLIKLMAKNSTEIQYRRLDAGDALSNPFVSGLADRDRLQSVVSFQDYCFHWPERMAIDAALDAEESGAELCNFTEVTGLRRTSGDLWGAELLDTLNGDTVEIDSRLVLNLAGAWVDQVSKRIHPHIHLPKKVVAVKGAYILVKLPDKYRGAGIAGINSMGEPICCLPWDDLHYVGPTETLFEGHLDDVRPEEEDVTFLLGEMRRFVPALSIASADVVMALGRGPSHHGAAWLLEGQAAAIQMCFMISRARAFDAELGHSCQSSFDGANDIESGLSEDPAVEGRCIGSMAGQALSGHAVSKAPKRSSSDSC